jgi:hypothetical protein
MNTRSPNIFEKILLIIGVMIVIIGYSFIHQMYVTDNYMISWGMLQAMFMWLLLSVMLIMLAVNENVKEELKIVIEEHLQEIKLLRQDIKSNKKSRSSKR